MSIKVLDDNTINKIAAGEVVENASSVVKELIENSIDANAKNIKISIEDGGLKLIKVTDDGDGIQKDDITLSFKEHATSKIKAIEDLESIESFGFRGEALPSIAAVSDVTIITKNNADNSSYGYKYSIIKNIESKIEETASNIGTSVIVENLFDNVPVRKKFLKSVLKENSLTLDIVTKFSLSNPNIAFSLYIDGVEKYKTKGDGDVKLLIYGLYGKEVYDNLIKIDLIDDYIHIYGYVAKPQVARNTRNDEIYFVNGRYVKSKIISNAIENAFSEYLMQHKFPLSVINIDINGKYVDVNVHPKKLEVRISREDAVYLKVYEAISNALNDSVLIHEEKLVNDDLIDENKVFDKNRDIEPRNVLDTDKNDNIDKSDDTDTTTDTNYKDDENTKTNEKKIFDVNNLPTLKDILSAKVDEGLELKNLHKKIFNDNEFKEVPFVTSTLTDNHRYIGQVFDTYILVEYNEKLYIIDQHAAHEKINFEKIMKLYRDGEVESQKIFPSIILKLTPKQYVAIDSNIDKFEKLGYEISPFGDREIKIDAVPYSIFGIGSKSLLMDMIDSFTNEGNKEQYESIVEKIASISCKSAIKANHKLNENEVKELLRELFKLDNPYNCPHGRPTIISLSKYEFEKRFGRVI